MSSWLLISFYVMTSFGYNGINPAYEFRQSRITDLQLATSNIDFYKRDLDLLVFQLCI